MYSAFHVRKRPRKIAEFAKKAKLARNRHREASVDRNRATAAGTRRRSRDRLEDEAARGVGLDGFGESASRTVLGPHCIAVFPASGDRWFRGTRTTSIYSSIVVVFDPQLTYWHITFGTYGTRLHGGPRLTVHRRHNRRGTPFIEHDAERSASERNRMRGEPVLLTAAQRSLIEARLPLLCSRGGWAFVAAAAEPDHVHLLCGADRAVHGKQIRALVKRWLTQALNDQWPAPLSSPWWADGGSTKPVNSPRYFQNVCAYIEKQQCDSRVGE